LREHFSFTAAKRLRILPRSVGASSRGFRLRTIPCAYVLKVFILVKPTYKDICMLENIRHETTFRLPDFDSAISFFRAEGFLEEGALTAKGRLELRKAGPMVDSLE
jgi:hypothetical protein